MRPDQGLGGPGDQVLPGLGQHRNGYILGHVTAGDELSDEVEIGLGGRRETDLYLLVAQGHEQFEHPHLAFGGRSDDEAWLPSRRSVDSQRGALVMRLAGQVRSGTTTGSKAR